jgi:hypothetical protein
MFPNLAFIRLAEITDRCGVRVKKFIVFDELPIRKVDQESVTDSAWTVSSQGAPFALTKS